MAYFRGHLYWTDYSEGSIKSLNLNHSNQNKIQTIIKDVSPLFDLKLIDVDQKFFSNACNNQNCEHLCLVTPNGSVCNCSDGYKLSDDMRTCEGNWSKIVSIFIIIYHIIYPVLKNYSRPSICKNGEFECRQTSQCIDYRHICDGDYDCVDGSDEDDSPGSICGTLRIFLIFSLNFVLFCFIYREN